MKTFLQKLEDDSKTKKPVVMAFGRMNPPTTGHEKLVNKVKEIEGDRPFFLTLYSHYTNRLKEFGQDLVTKINIDNFYGFQACLYSESLCKDFAQYVKDNWTWDKKINMFHNALEKYL